MAKRTYETDRIRVHWNSERCIHTAICLKTLPQVFDVRKRPWIEIEAAEADDIAQAIEKCPTGALSYTRLDEFPGEQPPAETTIVPFPHGPLHIRGKVEIRDTKGNLIEAGNRMTLCRCGHSQNPPFCDLSHRKAGFRSRIAVENPEREQAQSPEDIKPPSKD